jgi:hypothetical protein
MKFRNDSEEGRIVLALCAERDQLLGVDVVRVEKERSCPEGDRNGVCREPGVYCTAHYAMLESQRYDAEQLAANLRARLDALTHAAREVCRIVPPPTDGHARHTKTVLVVDTLRDALKKGEGLR